MDMHVIAQSQITRGLMSLILLTPLFVESLSPHPPVSFISGTDIYAHWGGFFIVSIAVLALLYDRVVFTLICLFGLAIALEAAQTFVDGRYVSAGDTAANLFGVLCAFVVFRVLNAVWPAQP
jgi:VanZ family protein